MPVRNGMVSQANSRSNVTMTSLSVSPLVTDSMSLYPSVALALSRFDPLLAFQVVSNAVQSIGEPSFQTAFSLIFIVTTVLPSLTVVSHLSRYAGLALTVPSGSMRDTCGVYHAARREVSAVPSPFMKFICAGTSLIQKCASPPCLRFSRGCGL
jgi:hypothetical protein